jgi:hypothetical protein
MECGCFCMAQKSIIKHAVTSNSNESTLSKPMCVYHSLTDLLLKAMVKSQKYTLTFLVKREWSLCWGFVLVKFNTGWNFCARYYEPPWHYNDERSDARPACHNRGFKCGTATGQVGSAPTTNGNRKRSFFHRHENTMLKWAFCMLFNYTFLSKKTLKQYLHWNTQWTSMV